MKKRLGSAIMALFLVLSVSTGAYAAGVDALLDLQGSSQNGQTTLEVYLTAEGATNGRIEVGYDADKVEFVGGESADKSWVVSISSEQDGLVSFAWVGSELTDETCCVLTLVFDVVSQETTRVIYTAEIVEIYDSGSVMSPCGTVETGVWISSGSLTPSEPDIPVAPPTEPEIPVEPGDVEEPGETDEPEQPVVTEVPFTDIDHWAREEIITAYTAGLVKGTSETTFSPDAPITRGSFITLLYRLNGAPEVTGENPFADVVEGEYYDKAVIWGYNNGIVNGKSATEFVPNGDITRQELVTMLMRYAKFTGEAVDASAALGSFADANEVDDWAVEAVKWAVAEKIISGRGAGTLAPKGITTRAEAATILVRFAGL